MGYGRGETFDILAYPQGIGTMLFFYEESDPLVEKIKFDVAMVSESYNNRLRTVFVEAPKKRQLLERHQVRSIPTIILFDKIGTEFYRWLPTDFDQSFGKADLVRIIDRLIPEP